MNIFQIFIYLSLCSINACFVTAEKPVLTVTEGQNVTRGCTFSLSFTGRRKSFCKKKCEKEDILVETTGNRAQNGRYTIEYKDSSSVVYVSITNVTTSDSGSYRCYFDRIAFPDSSEKFEIKVEKAPVTPTQNWTPQPSPTSTRTTTLSSGPSTSPSASPESTNQNDKHNQDSGLLLYLGLTLVIVISVLSAAVLIFCWKRASRATGAPEQTEEVTEANRVYEDIREEATWTGSPPQGTSTIYSLVKYHKENPAEATDGYSISDDSERMTENHLY